MDFNFYIKTVFVNLLLPPGLIAVVLILALLIWRTRLAKLMVFVTAISVYLLSTIIGEHRLARSIETYPVIEISELESQGIQALVVLMAGRQTRTPETGIDEVDSYSMDRLLHAVRLHRASDLPIIISGGANDPGSPPLAEIGRRTMREFFDIEPLAIEPDSGNTWQNAQQVAKLMKRLEIDKVAVITHAWHMKRALYSFEQAGVNAIAAPTYFIHRIGWLTWNDWIPNLLSFRNSVNVLHEYLGLLWYRYLASK